MSAAVSFFDGEGRKLGSEPVFRRENLGRQQVGEYGVASVSLPCGTRSLRVLGGRKPESARSKAPDAGVNPHHPEWKTDLPADKTLWTQKELDGIRSDLKKLCGDVREMYNAALNLTEKGSRTDQVLLYTGQYSSRLDDDLVLLRKSVALAEKKRTVQLNGAQPVTLLQALKDTDRACQELMSAVVGPEINTDAAAKEALREITASAGRACKACENGAARAGEASEALRNGTLKQ